MRRFLDKTVMREVSATVKVSEAELKPLYADIEKHFKALRSKLAAGTSWNFWFLPPMASAARGLTVKDTENSLAGILKTWQFD